MPEIGEVARIVHFLRQQLVGKTLSVVKAQHDENVYGKVGTSAAEFEKAMVGKMVVGAGQQGKYFWLVMSSPPHPLMHFGMAGWLKIRGMETYYYKRSTPPPNEQEWPPKYWKFSLETAPEKDKPVCQAAFIDFRRFARIRLVDCPGDEIRSYSPLKENGPDPVIDKDVLTEEWLVQKCGAKRIPIKALLLDQANISGIGNWVGDEIMYDARIHPEQYSNTLSAAQIKQLHKSLVYVTSFAVETLSDSSLFPETWLFKHRWGKGKKDSPNVLPNGAKIVFLTVGGRTSAVVPSVQKKTGPVAGDIKTEDKEAGDTEESGQDAKAKAKTKAKQTPSKKKAAAKREIDTADDAINAETQDSDDKKRTSRKSGGEVASHNDIESSGEVEQASMKKRKSASATNGANGSAAAAAAAEDEGETVATKKRQKTAAPQTTKTQAVAKNTPKRKADTDQAKATTDGRRRSKRVSSSK